jgi:hypothetical protein
MSHKSVHIYTTFASTFSSDHEAWPKNAAKIDAGPPSEPAPSPVAAKIVIQTVNRLPVR